MQTPAEDMLPVINKHN